MEIEKFMNGVRNFLFRFTTDTHNISNEGESIPKREDEYKCEKK